MQSYVGYDFTRYCQSGMLYGSEHYIQHKFMRIINEVIHITRSLFLFDQLAEPIV